MKNIAKDTADIERSQAEKPAEVILNFFAGWQRENTRIRGANRRIFSQKKFNPTSKRDLQPETFQFLEKL